MRNVSRRFRALLGHPVRWTNRIEWSNNGGQSWTEAELTQGQVTCAAKAQIRWSCDLSLLGVRVHPDQIRVNTQLRVFHGIAGLPLLPMGRYRVASCSRSSESEEVSVRGESFESYVIKHRFPRTRSIAAGSARGTLERLIREVIPSASFDWRVEDALIPKIIEERERWSVIDGKRSSGTSISRALAARTFTGPAGEWVIAPVPSLADPVRWRAERGAMKITDAETWTDEGLVNALVVSNGATFTPRMIIDDDPLSPTYAGKSIDEGGMGLWPEFYDSPLITSSSQGERVGRAMLAERLGVAQQVEAQQLHDPTIEPGDVGLVDTAEGMRLVLPDSITYDLLGGPLGMETRTTLTRFTGLTVEAPDDSDLDDASIS